MNRYFLTAIIFLLGTIKLSSQWKDPLSSFTSDSSFKHASISVCMIDGLTGDELLSLDSDRALSSASLMKLVTTSAALELLGPEFRFITRVGYAGWIDPADSTLEGHIVIKGGGDPTLSSGYFPEYSRDYMGSWVAAIREAGIRKVKGNVIADASIFDYNPAAPGWAWADLGNYYGAGVHGLSVNDNMYSIHFSTGDAGTIPQIEYIDPVVPGLLIENRLVSEGDRDNGYVYLEPYGSHAVIRGQIPVNREDFTLKASLPDPPMMVAELFSGRLTEAGISIDGVPTTMRLAGRNLEELNTLVKVVSITTYSPPLSEIIKVTNTESVNLFAEVLLKYLGYARTFREEAKISEGIETVMSFLDYRSIDRTGLYMTDGSGLSRSDAVSSRFIASLLQYMKYKSPYSGTFVNSLAEAGISGTFEYYFRDKAFIGNLKGKSGTSTRVRNYAGYLTTSSGREVVFAVLVNNFDCTPQEVTSRVESLLKEVIEKY